MVKVKIYGIPGCQLCKDLVEELRSRGIEFEYIDVTKQGCPLWVIEKGGFPAVEICSYRDTGYYDEVVENIVRFSKMSCEEIDDYLKRQGREESERGKTQA